MRYIKFNGVDLQVSRKGEVFRTVSLNGRLVPRVPVPTYTAGNGAEYISIKKKTVFVHRLVAKLYVPNPRGLPVVVFKDGDPSNASYKNLRWSLRSKPREPSYRSKLSRAEVSQIRELLRAGVFQNRIARMYAVDASTISRIKNGSRWS